MLGVLSMVEDDEGMREICREDPVLGHFKNRILSFNVIIQ